MTKKGPMLDPQTLLQVGHMYVMVVVVTVVAAMSVFLLARFCCLMVVLSISSIWTPSLHSFCHGTVRSNILQLLGSDLTLLQGILHLNLISLLRPPRALCGLSRAPPRALCGAVDMGSPLCDPSHCRWCWVIMASILLQLVFLSISVWGTRSHQVTPRMHWRQFIWKRSRDLMWRL